MKFRLITGAAALMALALVATSCVDPFEEPLPRRDRLNYPVGLTFHPSGNYAYVVNSNFNARYRPSAGGTVTIIDMEALDMVPENTPYIPSFGGYIELNEDASKAYVTARQDNSVVAFDVSDSGDRIFCAPEVDEDNDNDDSDDQADNFPGACVLDRIPDNADGSRLPADPFGLAVYSTERDGETVDVLGLSHLTGQRISSITLPQRRKSAATFSTASAIPSSLCVPNSSCGANVVVQRPGTENLYVLGRFATGVAIFQPYINADGVVETIIGRGSFTLNPSTGGLQARGAAFSPNGNRLAVVAQRPDALYMVDITPTDPETGSGTRHRVVSAIPLGDSPSDIHVHEASDGRMLAYIPCYDDKSIKVVDMDAEAVVDEILLDASPYDFDVVPTCDAENDCKALVTLFDDTPRDSESCAGDATGCGSVAVIELGETNPRYHQVIKKIH
jgi:DNA-binding beta-propeller fold protein YncE